jgi:thiosulfate/3-mercaptopyruvate sulfurtransferase
MKKSILALFFLLITSLAQAGSNLVTTDWLEKNSNNADLLLIDMSDGLQYQRFHIPGAINLPYHIINQNIKGVSLSVGQAQLIKILGQIGMTTSSHVVIYDDTGGLHAARLFWELEQLGHEKVSIVDGGLVKWIRENRPVSAEAPKLKPAKYEPAKTGNSATASLESVKKAETNKTVLLDVRSKEEYLGNPKQKRSGHIPGARWWEWDQGVNFDGGFVMQDRNKLLSSLANVGLKDKSQEVILYCRSGHRASSAYLTLRELGFDNVRLYDGSMKEYGQHKNLPLKTGKEP